MTDRRTAVLHALTCGASTAVEVGRAVGVSCHTAHDYLRTLRAAGVVQRYAPARYRVSR